VSWNARIMEGRVPVGIEIGWFITIHSFQDGYRPAKVVSGRPLRRSGSLTLPIGGHILIEIINSCSRRSGALSRLPFDAK